MKLTNWLTFVQALLVMAACAYGQDVHYNYDRGIDFASYKTYQSVNLRGRVPDELIDRDIKRSIDEQLAQKGLTKVEKDANLYVGYQIVIDMEKGINLSAWGTRGGPGGWGGWGGLDSGTVTGQTSTIPVGMMLVDLYDPAKKQLIWRGDTTKAIDLKKDPDKNYKNLQKAMAKLFKNYPPHGSKWARCWISPATGSQASQLGGLRVVTGMVHSYMDIDEEIRSGLDFEQVLTSGLEEQVRNDSPFKEIVGRSAALQRVRRQVEVVVPTDSTVLLTEETGTGKELIARATSGAYPYRYREQR
jgi:hypothetical protein